MTQYTTKRKENRHKENMIKRLIITTILVMSGLFATSGLQAKPLTITITQGIESAVPIAVVPFSVSGAVKPSEDISQIVTNDLQRTGYWAPKAW
jgi:TolB protein